MTYSVFTAGGTGSYTYQWSGAFSTSNQQFSTSYPNTGTYSVSVLVRDMNGNQTTAQCPSTVVSTFPYPYYPNNNQGNLQGSCYGSPSTLSTGQQVTWTVSAQGGNGPYTYSWSGTENIAGSGEKIFKSYGNGGTKFAYVTITSGSQSITRSCSVSVQDTYVQNNQLSLYCTANTTNVGVNQSVTWSAYASGGNGYYTYTWSGTDGLSYGNAQSVQKVYTTNGQKLAYVTAYDNQGRSASATCSTNIVGGSAIGGVTVIRDTPYYGTPISGVYLGEVPATGITPSLKLFLFAFGILAWSLALGYYMVSKRKTQLARVGDVSVSARVEAFKRANLAKRG